MRYPYFLFCFLMLPVLFLSGCGKKKVSSAEAPVTVRTVLPEEFEFEVKSSTQGLVEAVDSAVLSAVMPGKIELLNVKEGDRIRKGQLLFRTDRKTLQNRLTLAEEMLKMAQERERTRKADLELAMVTFEKAEKDWNRAEKLHGAKAMSQDVFESAEVKYRKAKLAIEQAKASLSTAGAEVSFASVTRDIARKHLDDSDVYAPYDGVVTAKFKQAEEFCNAGTPVLKVEDPSRKRVAVLLSGLHYPAVQPGQTRIRVRSGNRILAEIPVTVIGKSIDPSSRTFELKGDLPAGFPLPSGSLCDADVIFRRRKGVSVPEEALLFRGAGRFSLFVVRAGKAAEVPVQPGITQQGRTELRNSAALRNVPVIVSGHYFVKDGAPVRIPEK